MKHSLALGTSVAVTALPAFGAIVTLDLGDSGLGNGIELTNTTTSVFFDLNALTATTGSNRPLSNTEFRVAFATGASGGSYGQHGKATFSANNKGTIRFASSPQQAIRYGYNTALDQTAPLFSESAVTESETGTGNWGGFVGVAFMGFTNGSNEGWLAIDYRPGNPGGSIELLQFQYGSAGEELTTPAAGTYVIPEPATTGALLAGCAAVFALRRRRVGQG